MSESTTRRDQEIVILCASYFDRLGHPLFAERVATAIEASLGNRVRIFGIEPAAPYDESRVAEAIPLRVIFGGHFSIESRTRLRTRYGKIGSLITYLVRLVSITHFYALAFRRTDRDTKIIDLECEPIQAALATTVTIGMAYRQIGYVLHAIPTHDVSRVLELYKRLSISLLKQLLRGQRTRVFFMNQEALEAGIARGLPPAQCALGGWGYDLPTDVPIAARRTTTDDRSLTVLAFGVMRRNKRISALVETFLRLDDARVTLRIVGRNLDVDLARLKQSIRRARSRTRVQIEDRYVDETEIPQLFADADVVVLSHAEGFQSLSGPMFLGLQYRKPILCFSAHAVAHLVTEAQAGIVSDLAEDPERIRQQLLQLSSWRYDPIALRRYTWSAIAHRMIAWA
jgi:glycosyltransferase involved in cell wall biosynthesis